MEISAFVPIKLKSERLPNKMMLPLGNKLLCQHIFHTLLEVKKVININIYCFCSDETIKKYMPEGVIFLKRDEKLNNNKTKGIEIYKSFTNLIKSDVYVLCHATSPFIKPSSIIKGIKKITEEKYDSAFSCNKIKTFCWYNNKPLNYSFDNIVRTQDIKPIFWETSAFYAFNKEVINNNRRIGDNTFKIITNNIESIDIDEKNDYELALSIRMNYS